MESFHALTGFASAALAIVSYVPYIRSITAGITKPHRTTFGIWSVIGLVQVTSYIASGAETTIWLPMVYTLGALVTFMLSLKHGVGGTRPLELLCLVGSLVGMAGWILTDNPHIALYLSILATAFGFAPTIKKAYYQPQTEDPPAWALAAGASFLNLLAVSTWQFYELSYPVFIMLFDGSVALLTNFPNSFRARHLRHYS